MSKLYSLKTSKSSWNLLKAEDAEYKKKITYWIKAEKYQKNNGSSHISTIPRDI